MVPFRQTSWQGLAVDANAMLNWRGSSIVPLMAIRAPLSEMSTTLQSRLAKPPSIEYVTKTSPDPHDSFRGSHRALQEPGGSSAYWPALEVQLGHKANERIRLNCHSKHQRVAA
jgi:hypothetical protein